jgi:hypothetical protein
VEARRTGVSTAELVRQGAELQLAFLAALRAATEAEDLRGLLADMLRASAADAASGAA